MLTIEEINTNTKRKIQYIPKKSLHANTKEYNTMGQSKKLQVATIKT